MAYFRKRGSSWSATVDRVGHKPITKSFPTKTLAQEWAREIERSIDAAKFEDTRMISGIPFGVLVRQYIDEHGDTFGRTKSATLEALERDLGTVMVGDLDSDRWLQYVRERTKGGASGVTVAVDLTYAKQVLNMAKFVWRMPTNPEAIEEARIRMQYAGIKTRSKQRDRRPTQEELDKLYGHFSAMPAHLNKIPYVDIIKFAIASAMRLGEIVSIRWDDLNRTDRTVIVRDRKDPSEKIGNDQIVPLLGDAFVIAERQPERGDRIFPYSGKTISSVFPRVCVKLGIKDLRFHDLRHEGVSRLFEQGYTIEQVALVSGHKTWENLKRYTQLKAKDLHRD